MPDLLDALADVWTDGAGPAWKPLYRQYGMSLESLIQDSVCRDCGGKPGHAGGAMPRLGIYDVCDGCAELDECLTRTHDRGAEWHVSHWGRIHAAADHDGLVRAQAKRRARYLAKHRSPDLEHDTPR